MRFPFHGLVVLLWLLPLPALAAQDLKIDAFVGQWQGSGISKTSQSLYFGETVRDFDVEIRRQGAGFTVKWTTVLRQGGDPDNPDVRRRSAEKTFNPSSPRACPIRSPARTTPGPESKARPSRSIS